MKLRKIQLLTVILIVSVIVLGVASFYIKITKNTLSQNSRFTDRSIHTLIVDSSSHKYSVEVVNSSQSITQGLSGRSSIGSDGMLFIFPESQFVTFWMKDMQFDLDLIWISGDQVIGVTAHVPKPTQTATEDQLPLYHSPQKITAVLEVPAGQAQIMGLHKGVQVEIQ